MITAEAQAPQETVRDATLQLWPEYDDPGLLVIYSGDFSDAAGFPQEIAVPLPANARGVQATWKEVDGRLTNQSWRIENGKLVYTLPGPGFHIEYYLDRPPSGEQRDISYTFEVPFATDSLEIRVQQPARATGFSLTPAAENAQVGADGLTYSTLRRTDLRPGDRVDLNLRYTKTDQGLTSAPVAAVQGSPSPQVEIAQPLAASGGFSRWLPWVLIGVGLVALVAAAAYWFLHGKEPGAASPSRNKTQPERPGTRSATSAQNDEAKTFCTQCGRPFQPDDRYCASCGAARRR